MKQTYIEIQSEPTNIGIGLTDVVDARHRLGSCCGTQHHVSAVFCTWVSTIEDNLKNKTFLDRSQDCWIGLFHLNLRCKENYGKSTSKLKGGFGSKYVG